MEKIRFSNKELSKNSKVTVVPRDYVELKNASLVFDTEKTSNINFTKEAKTINKWFPKSQLLNIGSKYYVAKFTLE